MGPVSGNCHFPLTGTPCRHGRARDLMTGMTATVTVIGVDGRSLPAGAGPALGAARLVAGRRAGRSSGAGRSGVLRAAAAVARARAAGGELAGGVLPAAGGRGGPAAVGR